MLEELWRLVRGKAVVPETVRPISVVESDADDSVAFVNETPWEGDLHPIAGFVCVIVYIDAKGRGSERLITCQRKDQLGSEAYLWAFCHYRQAVRQFKISRISEVFDAKTGESFASPNTLFGNFQTDRTQRTQPGWGLSVRQRADLAAVLNAVVFLAKCDRHYHQLERASLEEMISRYWLRFEAPGDPDCEAIVEYADRLAPDAETFMLSIARCTKDPALVRLLKQSAQAMVDADGVISAEEAYWGTQVDKVLARYS